MLIPKTNYEHALKVGFEGNKFGPGEYGKFSAAPKVHLTMARVDLNNQSLKDVTSISLSVEAAAFLLF